MRCIECEEIELARVRDERPVQILPVPADAMNGFPNGRQSHQLTRRRLLAGGMAGLASVYAPKVLGWESIWESAAEAAVVPTENCLVMIYLAGGNDGLQTLVPTGADYAKYTQNRPVLARQKGATTNYGQPNEKVGSTLLSGTAGSQLGLAWANVVHSGLTSNGDANFGFDKLYDAGNLAVMPAVDVLPNWSQSHFDNADVWFSGSGAASTTGWLGRWIDRNGSTTNPLQAVSIDTALSKAIRTSDKPVCAIPSLSSLGFSMATQGGYGSPDGDAGNVDINVRMQALAGVPPIHANNAPMGRSRGTYGIAVNAYDTANSLDAFPTPPAYPDNPDSDRNSLSAKLRLAAHLLNAGVGTRVITIHWGGFDTHGKQLEGQDAQLKELSRALGAFTQDLTDRGIEQKVATMVFSEFGRRVQENASGGTDHGAGGLMMMAGSAVKGGLASEWPGLGTLLDGNLSIPTNFRSIYRSVVSEWLGDDPDIVIGNGVPALTRGDGMTGLFK